MRYFIAIMLYVLIANPGWVSAESISPTPTAALKGGQSQKAHSKKASQKTNAHVPAPAQGNTPVIGDEASNKSQKAELAIVGKRDGNADADYVFKMGDTLKIKATGDVVKQIKNELSPTGSKRLALYLDNVRLIGLPVSAEQCATQNELCLSFYLDRNSYEDDSRKAWVTFLKKQSNYLMAPSVSLAVGNELPLCVLSAKPFKFYISTKMKVCSLLIAGLLIFFIASYMLVKHPAVLRDRENGYYSLGKSQMAFWGLLVVLTFVGVWLATETMEWIPPQVFILLGISGSTGLGAIVIGENKKSSELAKLREEQRKLEKDQAASQAAFAQESMDRLATIKATVDSLTNQTMPADSACFWRDICDDGNGMSFHRLQSVIWTGVLGVVFVWTIAQVVSMPEFPDNLLILMGISNGMYLGFKIPEKL